MLVLEDDGTPMLWNKCHGVCAVALTEFVSGTPSDYIGCKQLFLSVAVAVIVRMRRLVRIGRLVRAMSPWDAHDKHLAGEQGKQPISSEIRCIVKNDSLPSKSLDRISTLFVDQA